MENRIRLFNTLEFLVATPVAPSAQAQNAVDILQSVGATEACIIKRAPVLTQHRMVDDWKFIPWDQDTCNLPSFAWQRMVELQKAGVVPISYVIAHEPKKKTEAMLSSVKTKIVEGWSSAKTQMVKLRTAAVPVTLRMAESAKQWTLTSGVPLAKKVAVSAKQLAVAAAPVVLALTKATIMITAIAAAAIIACIPIIAAGMMAGAVMVDPILYGIFPADDDGDPVWIIVARWYD